ncbi:hypothetical protein BOSEA31B_11447 [Hyphomicrobiales bacterium]|nr:hypothetical protein BOSEA31B_11447 [Hyphomicrobiales bacterium]CAH1697242.1 hypothetical protein BOSEA1005_10279 [Hyphomicrobiales bacterium]CAI0342810.1 hypothetical protein BO1005MUT1_10103 [Hyphomicrobiales bacterium]
MHSPECERQRTKKCSKLNRWHTCQSQPRNIWALASLAFTPRSRPAGSQPANTAAAPSFPRKT